MPQTTIVMIPAEQIKDWASFHRVFREVLGFPDFYGCNMDAWIDCMTYVNDCDSGMSRICVAPGDVLTLHIDDAPDFRRRCPEQYDALIECTAFVNDRHMERGRPPVLALMLNGRSARSR
jgi:hypothetical protein